MDLQVHTKYALRMAINSDPQIKSPFVFQLTPVSSYRSESNENGNSLRLPVWPFYTASLRQVGAISEVDFKPAGFGMPVSTISINGDAQKKKKPYTRRLKKLEQHNNTIIQEQQPTIAQSQRPATPVPILQHQTSLSADIDFNALFGNTQDSSTLTQITHPSDGQVQITTIVE